MSAELNIIQNNSNFIIVFDSKMSAVYLSENVVNIFGFSSSELLGEGWRRTLQFSQSRFDSLKRMINGMLQKGNEINTVSIEKELFTANGESKWFLLNFSISENGELSCLATDITRKKRKDKILAVQSRELKERNHLFEQSIGYARYLQESVLPDTSRLDSFFEDKFVLYKPKDIVSGDFYWLYASSGFVYVAAIDCTGHGVPGAIVSFLANKIMKDIIIRKGVTQPSEILKCLDEEMFFALNEESSNVLKEGMDIALIRYEKSKNELVFSGAKRPLYIISKGNFSEIFGSRCSIGFDSVGVEKQFEEERVSVSHGDTIYLFSDGYTDQFGGENVKKFNRNRFQKLLEAIQDKKFSEQKKELDVAFESWKGKSEQIDDVLVIGLRV